MKQLVSKFIFVLLLGMVSGCQSVSPPTLTTVSPPAGSNAPLPTSSTTAIQPPATSASVDSLSAAQSWLAYSLGAGIAVINQDGSGRTLFAQQDDIGGIACSSSDPFMPDESADHRMVNMQSGVYLMRAPAVGAFYRPQLAFCDEFAFSWGDGGADTLLAHIDDSAGASQHELLIYVLPVGKIRSRIPLVKCASQAPQCADRNRQWRLAWSPNGRYLAFPAIQDGTSTDLFVYDRNDGSTRRLTYAHEEVARFWWSPDGSWLIMSEETGQFSLVDYEPALWAVSLASNEIRFLYTTDSSTRIDWVDEESFLTYEVDCCADLLRNLRLVKLSNDKTKMLFDEDFVTFDFDKANHKVFVWSLSKKRPQGPYEISLSDGTLVPVDPSAWLTPTTASSVPPQVAQDSEFSPNGRWQVLLTSAGVKLKNLSNRSEQVVTQTAGTQVIWCPDATCFYLVSNRILYRVSVPDLTLQIIDTELEQDIIEAKWVEKPDPN